MAAQPAGLSTTPPSLVSADSGVGVRWVAGSISRSPAARSRRARASLGRLQLAVAVDGRCGRAPGLANLLARADAAIRPVRHRGRALSPAVRGRAAAAEAHSAHPGVCQSGAEAEGERSPPRVEPSFSSVPSRAGVGIHVDASTWSMPKLFSAKQRNFWYPNQQAARIRARDVPCCSPKEP